MLASRLLGWRTICAVEIDPYCQRVLAQRQRDGHFDPFPVWDDIRTFDGRPWRGHVDVVSGGFPCQDISSAGRRAGLSGARSGLWFEMLRVISEVRPAYVFAENSPNLRTNGLDVVLGGLAELGYAAAWGVLGAWHVGAPHRRNRMWIVAAHADRCRERELAVDAEMGGTPEPCAHDAADADGDALREQPGRGCGADGQNPPQLGQGCGDVDRAPAGAVSYSDRCNRKLSDRRGCAGCRGTETANDGYHCPRVWVEQSGFEGVVDGVAHRVDRTRATGNGQVPAVAALAWRVLAPIARGG